MSRRALAPLVVLVVVAVGGVLALLPRSPLEPLGAPFATATPDPTPRATPVPLPGHEVYGYVPYWEMEGDIVEHVAATPLTTLGLFSVTHTRSGALDTDQNGYRLITGDVGRRLARAAQDAGARVELVYTSFGEEKNARFYADAELQERTIAELVALTADLELDGVNVDVESLAAADIGAFADFVGRLRDALRARIDGATVSVATTSGARGAAMASLAAANGADRIFVMGYDYHWSGSDPGASSPLDRLDPDARDLPWTLDAYLAAGVPVERTILGLPLYGMAWPVTGPEPDAPRTGDGDSWVPADNRAILDDASIAPARDELQMVERYTLETDDGWQVVYVDSPATLAPKLTLANERGLAGGGFWALGYERGLPGYAQLIERFAAGDALLDPRD